MVLSLAIAVPLGVYLALRGDRPDGAVLAGLTQLGIVVPSFLVGILAVALFSVRLGWLPANGWGTPAHLVLPVVALTLVQAAILTRYVRHAVADEMGKDYARTARARGHRQAARSMATRCATRRCPCSPSRASSSPA